MSAMGKYKYHFRPCYNSTDLLLEFFTGVEDKEFLQDLLSVIKKIQPELLDVQDLWMNDEIFLTIQSTAGSFLFSKDVWGFAFIMSEKNQEVLHKINSLLTIDPIFEKVEVDFAAYNKNQ